MNMDEGTLDALDRKLFALPLEEPPADLRSSILLATAYRPISAFSFWELAVAGALSAVAIWLLILLVMGGGSLFVHTVNTIATTASSVLSSPLTLAWLAAGIVLAAWLSDFTLSQPVMLASHRSGRENVR